MVSNLRARHKLIGIFEAQIREDVAGAFFELNWSEWTQAAATAGTRDLKAQDRDRGWPASAANASDFVQIPLSQVPRRETLGSTRTLGAGALVDRALRFFNNYSGFRGDRV